MASSNSLIREPGAQRRGDMCDLLTGSSSGDRGGQGLALLALLSPSLCHFLPLKERAAQQRVLVGLGFSTLPDHCLVLGLGWWLKEVPTTIEIMSGTSTFPLGALCLSPYFTCSFVSDLCVLVCHTTHWLCGQGSRQLWIITASLVPYLVPGTERVLTDWMRWVNECKASGSGSKNIAFRSLGRKHCRCSREFLLPAIG